MPSRPRATREDTRVSRQVSEDASEVITEQELADTVLDGDEEAWEDQTIEDGVEDPEGLVETEPEPAITGPPPLPPHLKDISSLASWTVSTAKPGCSVAQLRAPSTALFWQSDGPQPHLLNIHFFKMVEIAAIRIHLDFELDESYTPTKIAFLAGTGYADLQEWCVMTFEQPRGWMDVDFSGVGAVEGESDEEGEDGEDGEEDGMRGVRKRWPVLRCMLVQVQIIENHQNGKDTHLRGLQICAKDKGGTGVDGGGLQRQSHAGNVAPASGMKKRSRLPEPQWFAEPVLR